MRIFDRDQWREILHVVRANPLRSTLTGFGVFWGMLMLITMVGIGSGLEHGVSSRLEGRASNAIFVWARRTAMPYKGMPPGRRIQLNNGDAKAVRDTVEGLEYFAPRMQLGGWRNAIITRRGARSGTYGVMGDFPEVVHIDLMKIAKGRFINDLDIRDRRKVAVVGSTVARELFARGENPIGKEVQVDGVYFTVAGVLQPRYQGHGDWDNARLIVPATTFQQAFNYGDKINWMAATAVGDAKQVEEQIRRVVSERQRVHPQDRRGVGSYNLGDQFAKSETQAFGIKFVIWLVSLATLLIGVIGVSNIMMIGVRERTNEFGLRKAIGATPLSIVLLLVQEALMLTAIAGCSGFVCGVAALEIIDNFVPQAAVDFRVAIFGILALTIAGVVAAVIPAYHAVRINPVQALRAEE